MGLTGMILKAVASTLSTHSLSKRYCSPPPELEELETVLHKKKKKKPYKYAHVCAKVDSSPPLFQPSYMIRRLGTWKRQTDQLYRDNVTMVNDIKRYHFTRGKVDSRWRHPPIRSTKYYENRVNVLKHIQARNKVIYKGIISADAKVVTTKEHLADWAYYRHCIIQRAQKPFVLFRPVPSEDFEDPAFRAPEGVKRPRIQLQSVFPRVHLLLGIAGAAALGELTVELFTEVCPLACRLFLDLADGDGLGHGYIGTCFYTKVPGLYWSGGDVIYNNGFGCYAQRGRTVPIGAENYHFSHSMPRLLSMRMTSNDEMCGTFNITFKALPQFDLKNVVFGRIVRPSQTFAAMSALGSPLSTRPVVEIRATRRRDNSRWVCGLPNLVLKKPSLRSVLRKTS